jgi:5-hydroxyisourate hydrolase
MSSLSTHVLDAVRGEPAAGVRVEVYRSSGGDWSAVGGGATDADGRIPGLAPDGVAAGDFRIVFATGDYFEAQGLDCFYPEVVISFRVTEDRHYHVPLLLSPYAFSTYRGS